MPDIKILILLGLVAFASYLKDKVGKRPELHLAGKAGYYNIDNAKFMQMALHADGVENHQVEHGSVVVRDGDVIGKGWSASFNNKDLQSSHAEFTAIRNASKVCKNSLHGSYLY